MERRALIVDDEPDMGKLMDAGLRAVGIQTRVVAGSEEALALVASEDFDVVLTDLQMPGMSGLELCERLVAQRPDVPVVVVTGHGTLETAIGAIRAGAYDFVQKPIKIETLQLTVERALRHHGLSEEIRILREVALPAPFEGIVGQSAPMRTVFDLVARVAPTDASVLLTGESGTGKELVARALHGRSRRHAGPFVPINLAAVPESLVESELFGHARGAFTDARSARTGLFLQASGGTLFLDEIGEMPLSLQPKLLRALQERTIRPVGGDHEIPIDVRIVAATNRDLEACVEDGRFREDLFYRINVVRIELPPLRARGQDILQLAQQAVDRFAHSMKKEVRGIAAPAAERLLTYDWPGNVRELQNAVESAVALTRFSEITVDDLPEKIRDYKSSHVLVAGDDPGELPTLDEVERRYILRVMQSVHGNKALASRVLGLDRKTLYRKLDRYGAE
ncbi:MAG TPA: sigma-54 dependent transcriptional regulator [Polyangia bacterium]|nr:sigma-54 dependent transcriptional regulator [Polyangia bacterium]